MYLSLAAALLTGPLLLACAPKAPTESPSARVEATVTGAAMGGELRVVVRCPSVDQHPDCLAAALAARSEVERIEALATDWSPTGELARLNAAAGAEPVDLSAEVLAMLLAAGRVSEATEGAFDVTVNALWRLWDFEAGRRPDATELEEALPLIGWRELALTGGTGRLARAGMSASLGGVAQGYAAEQALARVPSEWEALVDVSGDIAVRGTWEIGLQHPRRPRGEVFATVGLTDAVLTTSGDYERFFEVEGVRYHHVLDPRTGEPATGAWSATVAHSEGAIADALATALVVTGSETPAVAAHGAWAGGFDGGGPTLLGELGGRVSYRPADPSTGP